MINGSFEEPDIKTHPNAVPDKTWGMFPQDEVPGWYTTASDG
ncbi:hypothetical protein [Bacillus sp. JCM 19034]|nr:hypothetical protein [Bacillus sp. JCM 19034]